MSRSLATSLDRLYYIKRSFYLLNGPNLNCLESGLRTLTVKNILRPYNDSYHRENTPLGGGPTPIKRGIAMKEDIVLKKKKASLAFG